jgi:hypothetical protein
MEDRMRTLPALILAGSLVGSLIGPLALAGPAEARKHQRYYQPRAYQPYYYRPRYQPPGPYYRAPRGLSYEQLVCEERAQAADPSGQYAGYPCWAREAFGRGQGGRGR